MHACILIGHTNTLRVTTIPGRIDIKLSSLPVPQPAAILFPTGAGDVGKILMHRIAAATHRNQSLVFLAAISSLRNCRERFTVRLLRFVPETEHHAEFIYT